MTVYFGLDRKKVEKMPFMCVGFLCDEESLLAAPEVPDIGVHYRNKSWKFIR